MKPSNTRDAAAPEGVLKRPYLFVRGLLNDPQFPEFYQKSHTIPSESPLPNSVAYDLVPEGSNALQSLDTVFVGVGKNQTPGQFFFSVFLTNFDARESETKIDWEAKSKEWDAFIARHWPDVSLDRETDWRDALGKYSSGRGIMRILYTRRVEDIVVDTVELDIRVGDGLIGGLSGGGYGMVLKRKLVTLAPSRSQVVQAILKQHKPLQKVKILSYFRIPAEEFVGRMTKVGPMPGFMIALEFQGRREDGILERIRAEYLESSGEVNIQGKSEVPEPTDVTEPAKPITVVADGVPFWSADGKSLFFATTREAKDRPYWLRGAVTTVKSVARFQVDKPTWPLELIRPVSTEQTDMHGYALGVPSPSGKYLVVTHDGNPARFFIIDLKFGEVHNPHKDWSRDPEMAATLPPEWRGDGTKWGIVGCAWLPDEKGLLLSLYRDRDVNLYLATWQDNLPPALLNLTPVAIDVGNDILPCFSNDGKRIAWVNNIEPKEQKMGATIPEAWKFITGDYDNSKALISTFGTVKNVVTNRLSADLPAAPQSVSWDDKKQRWLVVGESTMFWINREGETLKIEKIAPLFWQQQQVKPIAASISPQGRVAITAQLPTALADEPNRTVTTQIVFEWDGEGNEVTLLYLPAQNNLTRHAFGE